MSAQQPACTHRHVVVEPSELPLSCPRSHERLWDAHPRVFLPLDPQDNPVAVCPYCSTRYELSSSDADSSTSAR